MQNLKQLHRGENTMNENRQDLMISSQTQGKTTNPMDIQQESKEKILRIKTGILDQAIRRPHRLG
jgi:hypothetical protein